LKRTTFTAEAVATRSKPWTSASCNAPSSTVSKT